MKPFPTVTVLLSSFKNLDRLWWALVGYSYQTYAEFDIIITDDGTSRDEFLAFQERASTLGLVISYLWQEDHGFRKNRALNRAVAATKSEYLIFSDADIVPEQDFVRNHLMLSKPGYFIYGGSAVDIPEQYLENMVTEDIATQRLFDSVWLLNNGLGTNKTKRRLKKKGHLLRIISNILTFRPNAFIGGNSSAWRNDIIQVNGFDEDFMHYGSEDRDLGVRLSNSGLKGRRYTFSLLYVHLDHSRPYVDAKKKEENRRSLRNTKAKGTTKISNGVSQYL